MYYVCMNVAPKNTQRTFTGKTPNPHPDGVMFKENTPENGVFLIFRNWCFFKQTVDRQWEISTACQVRARHQ